MHDPWARIIRREAYGDVIGSGADIYHISANWIIVVICRGTRRPYNIERVAMKVDGMLTLLEFLWHFCYYVHAYWETSGKRNLNTTISREPIYGTGREEVGGICRTTKDL